MKTATLLKNRPFAAVSMLLVPLAALAAANPANAQLNVYVQPGVFAQPAVVAVAARAEIERFVVRAPDGFGPGRALVFRLVGTPGARVDIDIPGVVNNLPMAESRPGVYEARFELRRRDDPATFERAVATLHRAGQRMTAQVDVRGEGRWNRHAGDQRGPDIRDVTPLDGDRLTDRGRVQISARYGDNRSGVDLASVQLRVDGRDVTRFARFDQDSIHFREDLAPGRHTAELSVRDRAGNVSRRSWTFDVVDVDRRHGWGSGAQVYGYQR